MHSVQAPVKSSHDLQPTGHYLHSLPVLYWPGKHEHEPSIRVYVLSQALQMPLTS